MELSSGSMDHIDVGPATGVDVSVIIIRNTSHDADVEHATLEGQRTSRSFSLCARVCEFVGVCLSVCELVDRLRYHEPLSVSSSRLCSLLDVVVVVSLYCPPGTRRRILVRR